MASFEYSDVKITTAWGKSLQANFNECFKNAGTLIGSGREIDNVLIKVKTANENDSKALELALKNGYALNDLKMIT